MQSLHTALRSIMYAVLHTLQILISFHRGGQASNTYIVRINGFGTDFIENIFRKVRSVESDEMSLFPVVVSLPISFNEG